MKNPKHYLTKEELTKEFQKCIEQDKCTDMMLKYFTQIARRFSTIYRNNNNNRTDWNAIVNYAVSEAWVKWREFNPEKSDNIFSFYTTMIANDMRAHYRQLNRGKDVTISIEALFTPNN